MNKIQACEGIKMKMRKFLQNKLWRDKAVSMMEKYGSKMHIRVLSDQEFDLELRKKVLEESEEVSQAVNKEKLTEEIADIYEVLEALMKLHGIESDQLARVKEQKKLERGGFQDRVFVESAEHPEGSFGVKYCLADPEKYPEIEN